MSVSDSMREISDLISKRDAVNRSIERACSRFVRTVVAESSPARPVASVILQWDKEGTLEWLAAYDADYETVLSQHNPNISMYVAPLYRPGHIAIVYFANGEVEWS